MQSDFKKIVDEYNGILYKITRSYTANEEDFKDLYQEILVQLWKSMTNFKGNAKISTWIYRVALNTALTHKRNSQRKPRSETYEMIEFRMEISDQMTEMKEKEEKIELLYRCINLLKEEDRAIILLYLEGKKYKEIAEIIGLTTSHLGVKIKRIKKRLHDLLNQHHYGRIGH